MTDRRLAYIVRDQKPVVLAVTDTVQHACQCMCEHRVGSVLVTDDQQHLRGIFTGRDAVRALAQGHDASKTRLLQVMTTNPVIGRPEDLSIDALRAMNDGGFRYVPVVDEGRILGVVSRSDFSGVEIERLDEEVHLSECIW